MFTERKSKILLYKTEHFIQSEFPHFHRLRPKFEKEVASIIVNYSFRNELSGNLFHSCTVTRGRLLFPVILILSNYIVPNITTPEW
jgi:hypothetical protein